MAGDVVTLDYGSGGLKTARFIEELLLPALGNAELNRLRDAAHVPGEPALAFTTDSFVVSPLFFPGGDIGRLCVCGTVNDLCVSGAEPRYLSLSLIVEEGFPLRDMERVLASVRAECAACGVSVVTGDTKVVERGRADGLYINTAGIGFVRFPNLGREAIRAGDAVVVSGDVGAHAVAVMLARSDLGLSGDVLSDCAPVAAHARIAAELGARILRDPTRGGLATTLCEFVERTDYGIELDEARIPVSAGVASACALLGLDPLYCACEGRLAAVVPKENAGELVEKLRGLPGGARAAVIGEITREFPGAVAVKTAFGGRRVVQKLSGAQLPRIC